MTRVDPVNNKSRVVEEAKIMNTKSQQTIKAYSMKNTAHRPVAGGCLGKGRGEIVDPGANKAAVFKKGQPDSQSECLECAPQLKTAHFIGRSWSR
jgi:hypothetical protein